jgi:hypothetical protein
MGYSPANVCLWRLHGCMLGFIHQSATGVAEIAESTNLKGCPHTFGHVVYFVSLKCFFLLRSDLQNGPSGSARVANKMEYNIADKVWNYIIFVYNS